MEHEPRRKGLLKSLYELLGEDDQEGLSSSRPAEAPSANHDVAVEPTHHDVIAEPVRPQSSVDVDEPAPPQPVVPVEPITFERFSEEIIGRQADAHVEPQPEDRPEPLPELQPEPLPEPELAPELPSGPPWSDLRLTSPNVADRIDVLQEISREPLGNRTEAVIDRLLHDPEDRVRLLALNMVAGQEVSPAQRSAIEEVLRRALRDPADTVRSRAAEIAATKGSSAIVQLTRLLGVQRFPLTQRVAVDVLPGLIKTHGIDGAHFAELLERVAHVDASVLLAQRPGFAALATALGVDRLNGALALTDLRRLGAARLLVEEGSTAALQSVSAMDEDDLEEVRVVATLARSILRTTSPDEAVVTVPPVADEPKESTPVSPRPAAEETPRRPVATGTRSHTPKWDDLIGGLANALSDPDDAVRDDARGALEHADRDRVVAWVHDQLRAAPAAQAAVAAQVVEALALREASGDLLERASGMQPDERAPLVVALNSLTTSADDLVRLTRNVDATRRHEAVRLIGSVGTSGGSDQLKSFLQDSSGAVRLAALEVLSRTPDAGFIEIAEQVLTKDSSPAVRATAVKLLGGMGHVNGAARVIGAALEDSDPDVRSTAVEAISQDMAPAASAMLVRAAADPDERVRLAAIRRLADFREDKQALWLSLRQCTPVQRDELLSILDGDADDELSALATNYLRSVDPEDRALAVAIAGSIATPESIRQMIAALSDPETAVRVTAARALSQLTTPEAIPALSRTLKDPHPDVRLEAVRALGVIDDDDVVPALIGSLKDPEPAVREQAAVVLKRWTSPAVARRLVESLKTVDLSQAATRLLVDMGAAAVEPLLELTASDDENLRAVGGDLLAAIVGPEPFVDDLGSLDPALRARAVRALGAIGGSVAVDGLVQALVDPDEAIRLEALRCLGTIGDVRAFDAVKRTFQTDPVHEVVVAAESTLRSLGRSTDDAAE